MTTVVVDVSLDRIPAMTVAEAARTLHVNTTRVAQLCKAGYLESWKVGDTRMVSVDSVEACTENQSATGFPRMREIPD